VGVLSKETGCKGARMLGCKRQAGKTIEVRRKSVGASGDNWESVSDLLLRDSGKKDGVGIVRFFPLGDGKQGRKRRWKRGR